MILVLKISLTLEGIARPEAILKIIVCARYSGEPVIEGDDCCTYVMNDLRRLP